MITHAGERSPGLRYLFEKVIGNDPKRLASIEEEHLKCEIARIVYDLREEAGMARWQLAQRVGTTASAIKQIEDADTEGPALVMLNRIAAALGKKMEIRVVPEKVSKRKPAAIQPRPAARI